VFEYQFVGFAGKLLGGQKVTEANGEKIKGNLTPWQYANALGKQGWEMVAIIPNTAANEIQMVFKRRV
jgi:hypothetical protein